MRRALLLVALAAATASLGAAALPAGAAALTGSGAPHHSHPHHSGPRGSFTEHTYPAPGAPGAREYWLYIPAGPPRAHRPVVVFLHGCNQTAVEAAAATRFNLLADQRDFIAVYPQQNVTAPSTAPLADGNGIGCWNWFLPEDQTRGSGEPATIAGLTQYVVSTEHADPNRVYVDGISAGADMAVILGATNPDVYAAVGVIAGCAYRTCSDVTGELAYQAMGPRARVVPMFVENGTADTLNPFPLGQDLVQSWLGADNLATSGTLDGSIPRTPASVANYDFNQTPQPGSGDACIHNDSLTCPGGVIGFQGSYPYTVERYADAHGCDILDFWAIHGMEHAYPDAPGDAPYTDPLGPNISTATLNFFFAHPMSGGGCPPATQ
ncbi:MAG: extracellular catalytic domain type 1 short-chain-length polyhydroxyalkanoate depolymerase [Mycobacteriales bacterium]